jgi:small-conductance mechanosensitive channel
MTGIRRGLFTMALAVLAMALVGVVLTRFWLSPPQQPSVAKGANEDLAVLVDERPLAAAKNLARLASTPEERDLAQKATMIADHEVDLAFTSALRNATWHPAPLSAAAQEILARVESIQERVTTEQGELAKLKQGLAKAEENAKADIDQEIQLTESILEVDQEDLDAARQELIRAGGDPRSKVQRLIEQHEAWGKEQKAASPAASSTDPQQSPRDGSRTAIVQVRLWRQLAAKEKELVNARQELRQRLETLSRERQTLAQESSAPNPPASQPADSKQPSAGTGPKAASSDTYSALKQVAEQQRALAEADKRTQDLQQLDGLYQQWDALVKAGKKSCLIGLVEGALWIVAFLMLAVFADPLVRSVVSRLVPESRRRQTIQMVARFAVQVMAVALMMLVLLGPPNQLATVLALTGAGLTVALKDFIVGFFGWFVLMGRNGIRPGDWVEINGIGGEVLEVGLLHTVLLETGNWSDAGHPTGRKVTFVNSYAIEGHYFNFSTSGQWLWDELEVPIPADTDPYPIADAVQKTVMQETNANMLLAQQEWQHAVPGAGLTSASPVTSVRPTTLGVNVIVRYITRAQERHEVRSRLFRQIVELLRNDHVAPDAPEKTTKILPAAS